MIQPHAAAHSMRQHLTSEVVVTTVHSLRFKPKKRAQSFAHQSGAASKACEPRTGVSAATPYSKLRMAKTDDVEPMLSRGILSSFSELSAVKAARCCRLTLGPGHVTVSDLVG